MSRLVIDLPEHQSPKSIAKGLRYMSRNTTMPYGDHDAAEALADSIEAAADKQYVVLDPAEVTNGFGTLPGENHAQTIARCLRDLARRDQMGSTVAAAMARDLADRFAPPPPDEPKEFGAKATATLRRAGGQRMRLIRSKGTGWSGRVWAPEDHGTQVEWSELSDVTLGWDDETGSAS